MDGLINWGFPASESGRGRYALLFGGANNYDASAYCGAVVSDDLKYLFKELWNLWESHMGYAYEEPGEYILNVGDTIKFTDGMGDILLPPKLLQSFTSPYVPNMKEIKLSHYSITLENLVETLPYSVDQWGPVEGLGEGAVEAADTYWKDCKTAYYQFIDNLNLTDYEKNLQTAERHLLSEFKKKGVRYGVWHHNIELMQMSFNQEEDLSIYKIVYLISVDELQKKPYIGRG